MADDEADLDNWEEQADSGMLDKRLEEMTLDLQNKEQKKKLASTPVITEDSGRTQYQPQVRILRRDAKSPSSSLHNHTNNSGASSDKSSKHSKSLQQREAEYKQARLRIFGALDDEDGGGGDDEASDEVQNVSENSIQNQSSPNIIKHDPSTPHVAVLRQPRGPDGTSGFKSNPT